MIKFTSVKTKLIMAIALLTLLLMFFMSYFIVTHVEQSFKQTTANHEYTLVASIAKEIDDKLDTAQDVLVQLAAVMPADIAYNPDQAQHFLDSHTDAQTIFDNHIFIFSADGKIIAESPFEPERRGRDFSHRDYIRKTLKTRKPYISEPYISSQTHHHPAIMFTAPVFDSNGKLTAILAGGLDLLKDNFLGGLTQTKIGKTGYVYLYTTDRTIIVHPDISRIMKQDVPLESNILFDKAIEGFDGTGETVNSLGIAMFSSFHHLKNTNWILVSNHPIAELYAPLAQTKQYFIGLIVISLGLLIIFLSYAIRHLTNPITRLTHHVEQLFNKQGQDRLTKLDSKDEIGALSQAFDKMVIELDCKTKYLETSEELYRTMVQFASEMIFWLSPEHTLYYISPNCHRITGYSDTDFYEDPDLLARIVYPADLPAFDMFMDSSLTDHNNSYEFRIINKNNDIRWVSALSRLVRNEDGIFKGIRASYQDITQRKQIEQQLQYISVHDALTGLLNRASFEAELKRLETTAANPISIIICDVDGLKLINDTFGHQRGDLLLKQAAKVLQTVFPKQAKIYRIGGDEFVIILGHDKLQLIEAYCEQINRTATECNINNSQLLLSLSIGFAISSPDKNNIFDLFKQADDNMYRHKLLHSKKTRSTIIQTIMNLLDAKDTENHTARLQKLLTLVGHEMGLTSRVISDLKLLAQFHDIGKVGISDQILLKPGPLDSHELLIMKRHPEIGHRIALSSPELSPIADLILKHHEWWNGEGYPLGLQGKDIPLECRIFALADAYEALTSNRPDRSKITHEQAVSQLREYSGRQFDPQLVESFVQAVEKNLSTLYSKDGL